MFDNEFNSFSGQRTCKAVPTELGHPVVRTELSLEAILIGFDLVGLSAQKRTNILLHIKSIGSAVQNVRKTPSKSSPRGFLGS